MSSLIATTPRHSGVGKRGPKARVWCATSLRLDDHPLLQPPRVSIVRGMREFIPEPYRRLLAGRFPPSNDPRIFPDPILFSLLWRPDTSDNARRFAHANFSPRSPDVFPRFLPSPSLPATLYIVHVFTYVPQEDFYFAHLPAPRISTESEDFYNPVLAPLIVREFNNKTFHSSRGDKSSEQVTSQSPHSFLSLSKKISSGACILDTVQSTAGSAKGIPGNSVKVQNPAIPRREVTKN